MLEGLKVKYFTQKYPAARNTVIVALNIFMQIFMKKVDKLLNMKYVKMFQCRISMSHFNVLFLFVDSCK